MQHSPCCKTIHITRADTNSNILHMLFSTITKHILYYTMLDCCTSVTQLMVIVTYSGVHGIWEYWSVFKVRTLLHYFSLMSNLIQKSNPIAFFVFLCIKSQHKWKPVIFTTRLSLEIESNNSPVPSSSFGRCHYKFRNWLSRKCQKITNSITNSPSPRCCLPGSFPEFRFFLCE